MAENIKLSKADRTILSLMEYNPRITHKQLATACHLSKDTISYRIKRLEKEKIILGYSSFIDYKKLGHQSYKLYLKLKATTPEADNVRSFLGEQRNIFSIFQSNGNWNLACALFAKTQQEFYDLENELLEKFGDIIVSRRFCSMMDASLYDRAFFEKQEAPASLSLWGEIENNELDDIDKEIIRLLHSDSRLSLVHLSQKVNMSVDGVKNRVQRLKDKGIMSIYRTNINYAKLGFTHYKLLLFPRIYSDQIEKELLTFFKASPRCINSVRSIGPWKLEAEFLFKNTEEMNEVLDKLNDTFKENISDLEISQMRDEELFACKELLLE